jgi:hypothetical protein
MFGVSMRPSDANFSQNVKPRTGEIRVFDPGPNIPNHSTTDLQSTTKQKPNETIERILKL